MNDTTNTSKRPILSVKFWTRFGLTLICGFGIGSAAVGLLVLCGLDGIAQMAFASIPLVSIVCAWHSAREMKYVQKTDEAPLLQSGKNPR